jgi:AcrR family transcriptional regulator
VEDKDLQTRQRLIEAAARLFAERGFSNVTVREICRSANANVAAINYHFRGKQGLYDEIIQSAIRTMVGTTEEMQRMGEGRPAEEQLRIFVKIFLTRVVQARDGWIHHLMGRELSDPTPALDLVVRYVIRPRLAYLGSIVARLLECRQSDPRVARCVMSVQAQCLVPLRDKIAQRLDVDLSPKKLDQLAEHITVFSLAGIKSLR